MLTTIKKVLLLSLFSYSFVFPMRQVAQAALTSVLQNRQVGQILIARKFEQKASFSNSIVKRFPFVDVMQMLDQIVETQAAVDAAQAVETQVTGMTSHESVSINYQERSKFGVVVDETIIPNISSGIDLRDNPSGITPPICASSCSDNIINQGTLSGETLVSNYKSLSSQSAENNFQSSFSDNINNQNTPSGTIDLRSKSVPTNRQFSSSTQMVHNRHHFNDMHASQHRSKIINRLEAEQRQEKYIANLKSQVSSGIENFAVNVQNEKSKLINSCSSLSHSELIVKKSKLFTIRCELESQFRNLCKNEDDIVSAIFTAKKEDFYFDGLHQNRESIFIHNRNGLTTEENQKVLKALELRTKIDALGLVEQECNWRIYRFEQEACDKENAIQLQEAQFLKEKQEQEALVSYDQVIKNKYDSYNFDTVNCLGPELENQWSQRQKALSKTIGQDYEQYYQEFNVTPQTAAFLATHCIDYKKLQSFFGTALQQQLHGEICDVFLQAAKLQAQFPYQNNLLTNIVDFADAAHDANKKEQILLAAQLLDIDCYLLKLNSEIVHSIMNDPIGYAQAAVSGVKHGALSAFHMATHPVETINGLGKALYYVLETAALNSSEMVIQYPKIYEPMRDARNAQIVAGLKNLGQQIENSNGPQRFEALINFGTEFWVSGKIIHCVGDVCGFVKEQAKAMGTLEGVAGILEEQGLTQEFIQATEKLKVASEENIANNFIKELTNAEKNVAKLTKITSELQAMQELESSLQKFLKALEDVLKDTVQGETTKGRARQYIKNGCYEDAIKDFYSLNPSNVKKMSRKEGLHGILPDGRSVNVRLESSAVGTPTIEIMKPDGTGRVIKIRYKNKA